jgi:Ca2+-binding RTX toxin-like protein
MKKIHFAVAVAIACAGALLAAAPAGAAVSCSYSSGTHTMTVELTANFDSASIQRSGSSILVNAGACGGATVTNTDKIVLNGSAGRQTVYISMSAGAFEPGFTPEGGGTSEIEFQGSLLSGTDLVSIGGTTGADTITAGTGGFNLNSDGDADITTGGVEQRQIYGDAGNDTLSAAGGLGTGTAVTDFVLITGDTGNDVITGGEGSDSLYGGDDQDSVEGGSGNDSLSGGLGVDSLQGGGGRDYLYGDAGNDTVAGGGSNDTFYATADPDGNDIYMGGGGRDFITYQYRGTAALDISLDGLANDGRVGTEFDNVQPDIEDVGGSKGPNVIIGSAVANSFDGGDGADTITGGDGDDYLGGGDGADTLNGGDDADQLSGSNGADQINGGAGDDNFNGGPDNDVMAGGPDDDSFSSDSGSDGADDLSGGSGRDSAGYYRSGDMTITIDGNANDGLAGENDNVRPDVEDVSTGSGNDHLTGSGANNALNGAGGNDVIAGGAGADYLYGSAGDDQLTGGDGEDNMYGSTGADHFHALDGGTDYVDGGSDADTDVVNDSDPFDQLVNIP